MSRKLIAVMPTNYRRIVLHAIGVAAVPKVFANRKLTEDYSEQGLITQNGIAALRDLEVLDGKKPILGFHDHPREMWVSEEFSAVADHCQEQGWLRVQ